MTQTLTQALTQASAQAVRLQAKVRERALAGFSL